MKYTPILFTLFLLCAAHHQSHAEEGPDTKIIAADFAVLAPLGDWGDAAGMGFGPMARLDIPYDAKTVITGRVGYIHHISKTEDTEFGEVQSSLSEIPILAGARRSFGDNQQYYAGGELGFVMLRASQEFMGMNESASDTELGMNLGAGWRSGKLDLRASLFFPDVGELGDLNGLMVSAGWNVSSL